MTATDEKVVSPPANPGIQKSLDNSEVSNRNEIKPATATPIRFAKKIAIG